MNVQAIQILVLKDLFLTRRHLFAYFAAGMLSAALACIPNQTIAFIGFLLIMTVAIASGIHLIGTLLLGETIDQTRTFVMSLPVSLFDYSVGKIVVVLITFLIPWSAMFAVSTIGVFVSPWAKSGAVVILPMIFCFLLAGFALQLVTAVITESVGWSICVMVGCNVSLNVFLMKIFAIPEIDAARKSEVVTWPPIVLQILGIEILLVLALILFALIAQTRKRDLV
jgi:hypothetical protein